MYSNYQEWRQVPALQNVQTIGQHFRSNGYYTAGAGKIFHYDQVDTLGWDDYYPSILKPMPDDNFPGIRSANMPPFKYIDDSEELYNLDDDPEEWQNLASDEAFTTIKSQLAGYIPANPIDLPARSP